MMFVFVWYLVKFYISTLPILFCPVSLSL